jgi:leader peptidase (prepilin peptidase)/N-methyltransferase
MELLNLLETSRPWLLVAAGLAGLCVGSFLNVLIHRLPRMMEAQWRADCAELRGEPPPEAATYNLFKPDSRCPACGTAILPRHNVPVLSWLALGGKCAACRAPISARYPAIEALAGVAAVLLAWKYGYSWQLAGALLFCWALIALTFIDLDTQLLPDDITLPLLWLGLLFNVGGVFVGLASAVLGAVAGYLLLWSVYWAFRLLAKKEGMGYGDFKLLAAIGAWTGWQVLPVVVLVASLLGAVIGAWSLWRTRRGRDTRIPFGPYLAVGGLAGMLWGREAVVAWIGHFPA